MNYSSITAALSGLSSGTIWVAAGTYLEAELVIPTGVTVIGGFPANATTLANRTYPGANTNLTTLDGNYTHRVATVHGTLDGFVITRGYAYSNGTNGGGVLVDGGTVQNCILTNNIASQLPPTPTNIPGSYVASIGDIYCTDGKVLKPTYTVDSNGKYVASLNASEFTGHTVQGIVFYVDPAATTGHFLILGKPASSTIWFNCSGVSGQTNVDIPTVANVTSLTDASADFNGKTKTNAIVTQINSWLVSGAPWSWYDKWDKNEAPYYAYYYNSPAGTQGQWYLPAGGEMLKMWDVYPQMDACAKLLNWISSTGSMYTSSYFWTSTECSDSKVWMLSTQSYPWTPSSLISFDKTTGGVAFPIASINF